MKLHQYPAVIDETKTVGAAGDFATIQEGADWFKYRQVGGNCYLDADAGSYDEAVVFANIPIVPGATLTLRGDTRALAGLSFVQNCDINDEGLANGGSGVGALANAGANITVTGTITNPDFDADGWGAGDHILAYDNAGAVAEFDIAATLNNVITLTAAAPALGNDATAICLLPNRRIERTTAGTCVQNNGTFGIRLKGWYIKTPIPGANCFGILNDAGGVYLENVAIRTDDYDVIMRNNYGWIQANVGAISLWGAAYHWAILNAAQVLGNYSVSVGGTFACDCSNFSYADMTSAIAVNCTLLGFRANMFSHIYCASAWVRQIGLGGTAYRSWSQSLVYAGATAAHNNNPAGADYDPVVVPPAWGQGASFGVIYASA